MQRFARLYLFPGGYHCGDAEGPFCFDMMSAIMASVEQWTVRFRPSLHTPARREPQPVLPYPLTTKYTRSGGIDDAKNFIGRPAEPLPTPTLQWLGSSLYKPHYELLCQSEGKTAMSCKPSP